MSEKLKVQLYDVQYKIYSEMKIHSQSLEYDFMTIKEAATCHPDILVGFTSDQSVCMPAALTQEQSLITNHSHVSDFMNSYRSLKYLLKLHGDNDILVLEGFPALIYLMRQGFPVIAKRSADVYKCYITRNGDFVEVNTTSYNVPAYIDFNNDLLKINQYQVIGHSTYTLKDFAKNYKHYDNTPYYSEKELAELIEEKGDTYEPLILFDKKNKILVSLTHLFKSVNIEAAEVLADYFKNLLQ